MTVPHWRRSPIPTRLDCDVLVIGAGICGVSAALALCRRGLHAEVVDRCTLAAGASSRNAGFLMRGASDNYATATRLYGRPLANLIWRWTEENLAGLRREGIETLESVRPIPSCLLALAEPEHSELRRSLAMLKEDGFDAAWVESGADSLWSGRTTLRPIGGLLNPNDASCNPWHVMRHLASRVPRPVHDHQEVVSIEAVGGGGSGGADLLEARTTDYLIRCRHILACTNAFAPLLFPALAPIITPRRGQMIAFRAPGLNLDHSYYANRGSEYFRQAHDGTIVVGGCRTYVADRETGYDDRLTDHVQKPIERFAAGILGLERGRNCEIAARWSGTMGFSPDGLPLIGPVPGAPANVWFCGAFTGHGMGLAYRCAHAAVESMLDGADNPLPLRRALPADPPIPKVHQGTGP